MAQSIDDRLRQINGILEDNDVPCRLKTEMTADQIGRRFFLSWPNQEATQELVISFTVGGVHHWLDGLYHGLMLGTVGIAFDFPPNPECLTCEGRGYCQCQCDFSSLDQGGCGFSKETPSKADQTIQQIVATINDPDVVGHWDDAFDGIWEILHDAGYPVVVNEGE